MYLHNFCKCIRGKRAKLCNYSTTNFKQLVSLRGLFLIFPFSKRWSNKLICSIRLFLGTTICSTSTSFTNKAQRFAQLGNSVALNWQQVFPDFHASDMCVQLTTYDRAGHSDRGESHAIPCPCGHKLVTTAPPLKICFHKNCTFLLGTKAIGPTVPTTSKAKVQVLDVFIYTKYQQ